MARVLGERPNPGNPVLLGEDIFDLGWMAAGAGVSEFANTRFALPIVKQVLPVSLSGTTGKLVDAGTTAGSGWLVGKAVGMIDASVGRLIRRGGVMLGVAKFMSAFVPGFSMTASIPEPKWPQIATPAVKTNGNGTAQVPALKAQGYATSGL